MENYHQVNLHSPFLRFAKLWLGINIMIVIVVSFDPDISDQEGINSWLQVLNSVLLIGYLSIPKLHDWLEGAYLPIAFVSTCMSTFLIEYEPLQSTLRFNEQFLFDFAASIGQVFLIWFISVLLIAWQYRFRTAFLFILGVGVLNLIAPSIIYNLPVPEPSTTLRLIKLSAYFILILALVGYLASSLHNEEKKQKMALAKANQQLLHYAEVMEESIISLERLRLSHELHDTLSGTLSSLVMQLEAMQAYWKVDLSVVENLIDQSLAKAREGLDETRRAIAALRINPLKELGLLGAIRQLVEEIALAAELELELHLPDKIVQLDSQIEQSIYRIAQEALNNVEQYAAAKSLKVKFSMGDEIELIVEDDGKGFLIDAVNQDTHFGLIGMQERADLIDAALQIESDIDRGTRVTLKLPTP